MNFSNTVSVAFSRVREARSVLFTSLSWPFVGLMVFSLFGEEATTGLIALVLKLILICCYLAFAITVHRVILLGAGSVPQWGLRQWTKRETAFTLHGLGLIALFVLALYILSAVSWVSSSLGSSGGVLSVVVPLFIFGLLCLGVLPRLYLVFPSIAVEKPISFKESWSLTDGNHVYMIFVIVLFPLAVGLVFTLLEVIPYNEVLTEPLSCIALVYEIAILSVAYEEIVGSSSHDFRA